MISKYSLQELDKTIEFAIRRCLTVTEILNHLLKFENDMDTSLIKLLYEKELSDEDYKDLLNAIEHLIVRAETVNSKLKNKIDRSILRILKLMPFELSSPFAKKYFKHPLKSRRKWAYSIFRHLTLSADLALTLFEVYRKTKDQEALELIAKNCDYLTIEEIEFLFENLSDKYWRARAIEKLLINNRSVAVKLSQQYPFEYAHAVGRTMDISLLDSLLSLFPANSKSPDTDFLSIYAYALGKLKAKTQLISLQKYVKKYGMLFENC